ncbi:MAG: cupin domain-containing protein [Gemmataceae bacterium]|nr:cupin domain-containing protein [Gemmataceae bacterium]
MSLFFPGPDEKSRHTIFPGVEISTSACKEMMLSHVVMAPLAVVAPHQHPHEQVGIVLKGRAVFRIGAEEKELGPSDMYRIPSQVTHQVRALAEGAEALDIFHPIREDYL